MSGIQMGLMGSSGALDVQVVTTGGDGTAPSLDRRRGWSSGSFGTIADGTSNIYSGAAINQLYWDENSGVNSFYRLSMSGGLSNSGWTTLTIGSIVLTRASASFSGGPPNSTWDWTTVNTISTQAFGSISSTVVCTFT